MHKSSWRSIGKLTRFKNQFNSISMNLNMLAITQTQTLKVIKKWSKRKMGTREKKRREREVVTLFGGSSPRWLNQSSTSGPSKHIQTVVWVAYKYQHHTCTYTYSLWFTLIDFLIRAVNTPSLHVPFSPMHPNTSDWSIKTSGYTFCNLTVFNSLSPSFELSVDTTVFSDEVFPDASLPAKTIAIIEKKMKEKKRRKRKNII